MFRRNADTREVYQAQTRDELLAKNFVGLYSSEASRKGFTLMRGTTECLEPIFTSFVLKDTPPSHMSAEVWEKNRTLVAGFIRSLEATPVENFVEFRLRLEALIKQMEIYDMHDAMMAEKHKATRTRPVRRISFQEIQGDEGMLDVFKDYLVGDKYFNAEHIVKLPPTRVMVARQIGATSRKVGAGIKHAEAMAFAKVATAPRLSVVGGVFLGALMTYIGLRVTGIIPEGGNTGNTLASVGVLPITIDPNPELLAQLGAKTDLVAKLTKELDELRTIITGLQIDDKIQRTITSSQADQIAQLLREKASLLTQNSELIGELSKADELAKEFQQLIAELEGITATIIGNMVQLTIDGVERELPLGLYAKIIEAGGFDASCQSLINALYSANARIQISSPIAYQIGSGITISIDTLTQFRGLSIKETLLRIGYFR